MDSTNPNQIQTMFENIAKDYDVMNKVITLGLDPIIKKIVVSKISPNKDSKILDLCCGTGDITLQTARRYNCKKVVGIDFSNNMLDIAKKRSKNIENVEFIKGDVLALPFEDDTFDVCFISFGLRNVIDIKKCLSEMKRVTKKDGHISNLDLGKPNKFFNIIFKHYFYKIVPVMGKLFHGDSTPYTYLPESNKTFPSQDELLNMLKDIGYSEYKNYDYLFGAIAQQIAKV